MEWMSMEVTAVVGPEMEQRAHGSLLLKEAQSVLLIVEHDSLQISVISRGLPAGRGANQSD